MSNIDHALDALKFHLKKEIIDNYFAERTYLEEDLELLQEKEARFGREFQEVMELFAAFYQVLKSPTLIAAVVRLWKVPEPPFQEDCRQVSAAAREAVLRRFPRSGWTAKGRFKNLVFALYDRLAQAAEKLRESQTSLTRRCQLYNEDVHKFNTSFDFGLIATQIEALEGGDKGLADGLSAADREELQARMAIRLQHLQACHVAFIPVLPPLKEIKRQLARLLEAAA